MYVCQRYTSIQNIFILTKILKTRPIIDPALSEFIYTVAMTAPLPIKRRLPLKYFNSILTEKAARRFSIRSSMDQKKEFLEYMGFRHFSVFANVENYWNTGFKDLLKKYDKSGGNPSVKEISEDCLYVTSDKELVHVFTRMSHALSTKLYRMEQELLRVKKAEIKWTSTLESDDLKESEIEKKRSQSFIKMTTSIVKDFVNASDYLEVGSYEVAVLNLLYVNQDAYLSRDEIMDDNAGIIPLNQTTAVENKLIELSLIQPHVDYRKKEYTITSRGIRTVHQFRDRVLKSFNF